MQNKKILFLIALGFLCLGFWIIRAIATQSTEFFFLNFNLFLAALPFIFITITQVFKINNKLILVFITFIWLLFLPNAPYIFSDLIHITYSASNRLWYELPMILLYAITGFIYGLFSLFELQKYWRQFLPHKTIEIATYITFFLSGFGVYLGRYLRFNSWDIIHKSNHLVAEIADRVANPFHHPRTWMVTLMYGLMMCIFYLSIKIISAEKISNK